MDDTQSAVRPAALHPLLWIAGISVTLLSLAGIAALAGLLPLPAREQPTASVAAAPAAAPSIAVAPAEPAPAPAATAVPEAARPLPPPPARKAHPPSQRKIAKIELETSATGPAMLLPPPGSGVPPDYVPPPAVASVPAPPPVCPECGIIASVREITHEGQGSGVGAIAGGVLGGALANNLGKGNGRTLATIVGAVSGGMLGNAAEKSQHRTVSYQISVRMEDGTARLIESDSLPPWRIGQQVRLVGGTIVAR